jgi:linoleate 10R-lipoxygenase
MNTPQLLPLQFSGLWRSSTVDAKIAQGDGFPPVSIKAGDRIWASFTNAHLNVRFILYF